MGQFIYKQKSFTFSLLFTFECFTYGRKFFCSNEKAVGENIKPLAPGNVAMSQFANLLLKLAGKIISNLMCLYYVNTNQRKIMFVTDLIMLNPCHIKTTHRHRFVCT